VSYDLAVWEGPQPDTDDAAAAAFEDLRDRYLRAEARHEPTQKINRYVASLLIRWPDISDDAGACSPWASAPLIDEAIGPIVHVPMVFGQAAEAAGFAATLAWAQGVVCFDTQHGQLRLPAVRLRGSRSPHSRRQDHSSDRRNATPGRPRPSYGHQLLRATRARAL
jgi:hypothetical protein